MIIVRPSAMYCSKVASLPSMPRYVPLLVIVPIGVFASMIQCSKFLRTMRVTRYADAPTRQKMTASQAGGFEMICGIFIMLVWCNGRQFCVMPRTVIELSTI